LDVKDAYMELRDGFLPIQVWSGFYTVDEVLEDALEGLVDGCFSEEPVEQVDEELVELLVLSEFERKFKAEETWPPETACNRLTRAFEELTARGILSLENAGYTISDGWHEWDQAISRDWAPVGAHRVLRGGCFYHAQDLQRAVSGQGLFITYTARSGVDADAVPIAHEIVEILRLHGFQPEWSGQPTQRILVPIEWQRRYAPPASAAPPATTSPDQ